jgi:hypothetical protein
MSFIKKVDEQAIRATLVNYILARIHLLAWMAGRLEDIVSSIPQHDSVASSVSDFDSHVTKLLVVKIQKLDDEYAAKEAALFREYQPLISRYSKPHKISMNDVLQIAIAGVKNKINIAVAAVSDSANNILNTPQAANIEGAPKARLEYLSQLTLQKQIAEYEDIIERMKQD